MTYDENNINHSGLPQVLNLGAGVQSSTLALMAACGEVKPMPVAAIFADTQAEPPSVYRWLEWLEKQLPFPVHRVTAGSLTKQILTKKPYSEKVKAEKGVSGFFVRVGIPSHDLWPNGDKGHGRRQCTYEFKVEPLIRAARRIGNLPRGYRGPEPRIVSWMGISLDEAHRMKTPKEPWQLYRYPLVDLRIRRSDCLEWMVKHGFPRPPRSACVYCPYHSDHEWRRLRDEEPEAFSEAVRVDHEYRKVKMTCSKREAEPYLHHSCVPLDKVDFSTDEDHGQQMLFGNECEGMCGV